MSVEDLTTEERQLLAVGALEENPELRRSVVTVMQRWLDTGEETYPCHRALHDLAVLLELRRYPAPGMGKGKPRG